MERIKPRSLRYSVVANLVLFVVLLGAVAALAPASYAQGGRFEIQPFVGYKWGGSTDVAPNFLAINQLHLDSSVNYGVSATFNATDHFGLEFMWNRQPTTAVADLATGGSLSQTTGVDVDQYHGNILFSFGEQRAHKMIPFALVGFGASNLHGGGSSITKFSYGLGGGVKYFFSEHVGVRVQARYAPTYLYSTTGGIWCTWYGFCFTVPNDHYLNQGDVTGGLVFRF